MVEVRSKICLLGGTAVGKTTLVNRLTGERCNENPRPTIGLHTFNFDNTFVSPEIHVSIWDTPGDEIFRAIASNAYRNALAVLLLFDLTNAQTFADLDKLWGQIEGSRPEECKLILIGNKFDLPENRMISLDDLRQKSQEMHAVDFMETSALTGYGFDDLIEIIRKLIKVSQLPDILKPFSPKLPDENTSKC